jgi:hypothetical protein
MSTNSIFKKVTLQKLTAYQHEIFIVQQSSASSVFSSHHCRSLTYVTVKLRHLKQTAVTTLLVTCDAVPSHMDHLFVYLVLFYSFAKGVGSGVIHISI